MFGLLDNKKILADVITTLLPKEDKEAVVQSIMETSKRVELFDTKLDAVLTNQQLILSKLDALNELQLVDNQDGDVPDNIPDENNIEASEVVINEVTIEDGLTLNTTEN